MVANTPTYTNYNVSESDSGVYKCTASIGTAETYDSVTVEVLPVEVGEKAPQEAPDEGELDSILYKAFGGLAAVLVLSAVGFAAYFVWKYKKYGRYP